MATLTHLNKKSSVYQIVNLTGSLSKRFVKHRKMTMTELIEVCHTYYILKDTKKNLKVSNSTEISTSCAKSSRQKADTETEEFPATV